MSDAGPVPDHDPADALAALFAWYEAVGVDAVLGDRPVDRFAESAADAAKQASPVRGAAPRPAMGAPPSALANAPASAHSAARAAAGPDPRQRHTAPPATIPNDEAVAAAREAATSAGTLDDLRAALERFEGCNLRLTARRMVFADGNPAARLMLVGEAPGREEDVEGRPFVGRAGQLLDRMLKAAGFSREENAYIANVVYWRPPGNRDPSEAELAVCRPFILRQVELVDPDVLVLLGAQAAKSMIGGDTARSGIRRMRGQWLTFDTGRRTIALLPTFHPAYLLRQPIEKRAVWRDLLAVREKLDG
jgi:uracil-DNA glycosylase